MAIDRTDLQPGWTAPDTWGSRLKRVRKTLGWTQDELATAAGVASGTLSNWEAADRVIGFYIPSVKICAAADCDLTWLMTGMKDFDPKSFVEQGEHPSRWKMLLAGHGPATDAAANS